MASIRKRSNNRLSLVFWWNGNQYTKALGTADMTEAQQIKQDAEEQLARIRRGQSALASELLAEGFSIVDVLFGSPEIAPRLGAASDDNPFTLAELLEHYLGHLRSRVGFDQEYNTELRSKRLREFFGGDRRVMSLTPDDLEKYQQHRSKSVGGASLEKEFGNLKAAIAWAIDNKLLPSTPINRWPKVQVQRQKRFEWKSEIEALIESHAFKNEADRQEFVKEMRLRMVLTQQDMKRLIDLAREKEPDLVLPLTVVCSTGMRRKELVLLKKQDFDRRRGTIIVGSKKQSKLDPVTYRSIVLPEEIVKAVRAHHGKLPKSERMLFPVFSNIDEHYSNRWVEYETDSKGQPKLDADGKKIVKTDRHGKPVAAKRRVSKDRLCSEKARRLLNRFVKGTEFELMSGWHCLRHSFISICVAKGLTWEQIAEYERRLRNVALGGRKAWRPSRR